MPSKLMQAVYVALEKVHQALAAVLRKAWLWGDRIQSRARITLKLALGMTILYALAGAAALWAVPVMVDWIIDTAFLQGQSVVLLDRLAADGPLHRWATGAMVISGLCMLGAAAAFVRHRFAWWILAAITALFVCWWLWTLSLVRGVPNLLFALDSEMYGQTARLEHWMAMGGIWLAGSILPAVVVIGLFRNDTRKQYAVRPLPRPAWADRLVHVLRTGGNDPRFSTSVYWALLLIALILGGPFVLRSCGMEDPYGLIKGKGEPTVAVVKVKKKQKKKRKKYIVNAWSPYIFKQPEIDDIEIIQELEQETSDTYTAQAGKSGLGAGGPGKGGWPHGMMDGKIRFIRLEYDGGDWDQDMGKGADYNLLIRFHQITGFKIADDTEHLAINRLRRFPEDRAPPFVFLTGKGGMNLSSSDIKTLRWYCLEEGGCLFIDNGGGTFHAAVTRNLRRIFPDKSLRVIASDDPIFRAPFVFPNGAPPLWHHAGHRAMGIRHNGRWIVFYHPGDMNDAWKTGHSGAAREVAEQAYRLGINVMYYTFNQYHRIHFEQ